MLVGGHVTVYGCPRPREIISRGDWKVLNAYSLISSLDHHETCVTPRAIMLTFLLSLLISVAQIIKGNVTMRLGEDQLNIISVEPSGRGQG